MPALPLLPLLAVIALVSLLAAAVLLYAGGIALPAVAHIAFAVGAMPLIHAAITYFVPVLTRGRAAGRGAIVPPLLALGGGTLAVIALATDHSGPQIALAATLASTAAIGLGAWAALRARAMVGRRHPGMDWYLAALAMLVLALCAAALIAWLPEQRQQLRLFHLHANLLGFIGLTALGTLQVLVPTCMGLPDPEVTARLRRDLKWAFAGCLLLAIGAAALLPAALDFIAAPLAFAGGLMYAAVVTRMLHAWLRRFGFALFAMHGAQSSLAAGAAGLLAMLGLGFLHGAGLIAARPGIAGYVIAFLLPLVSGAISQLLPVWLRPGPQGEWHTRLRARLCRYSGARAWVLVLLGLLAAVA